MKTNLLIAFSLIFLVSACKKEKEETPLIDTFDEDVNAYFDFREGSYWVYKDAFTNTIDSVSLNRVIEVNAGGYIVDNKPHRVKEKKYIFHHSLHPTVQTQITTNALNGFVGFKTEFSNSRITVFGTPLGEARYASDRGTLTVPEEGPVSVGNFSFPKGIVMQRVGVSNTKPDDNITIEYEVALARNVGIINRKINSSANMYRNWELVNYKVIR
jgi:hypothetical protein